MTLEHSKGNCNLKHVWEIYKQLYGHQFLKKSLRQWREESGVVEAWGGGALRLRRQQ
jgi:hypothetical protein